MGEFEEFVKIMRLVGNRCSKAKLVKEQNAAKATKFTRAELKEFRQVFKVFDCDGSGSMEFTELQHMIATIVPAAQNPRAQVELLDILIAFDEDNSGELDFPEFLHVMRKLLDDNWQGIN